MNKKEREAAAQATHSLARNIDDTILSPHVSVSAHRFRQDRRGLRADDLDYEATTLTIKLQIDIPASDPGRARRLAHLLAGIAEWDEHYNETRSPSSDSEDE